MQSHSEVLGVTASTYKLRGQGEVSTIQLPTGGCHGGSGRDEEGQMQAAAARMETEETRGHGKLLGTVID